MITENIEEYYQKKYDYVAGVDEAGRGPLAGPVVAAAVVLPKDLKISGLTDSKLLTQKKRAYFFDLIISEAISYSIHFVDNKKIDEINILQATFLAMNKAVENLNLKPNFLLIDGNHFNGSEIGYLTVVKGDAKCPSISAASILAKVARDRYMIEVCHKEFPQYGFDKNKGYGVKYHLNAIKEYGICSYHRLSFLKKLNQKKYVTLNLF